MAAQAIKRATDRIARCHQMSVLTAERALRA